MANDTPPVDDVLMGALAALGPWGAVAGLAVKFGLPFVTKIIQNAENKTPVTAAEWDRTKALADIPGEVLVPQRPLSGTP